MIMPIIKRIEINTYGCYGMQCGERGMNRGGVVNAESRKNPPGARS